MPELCEATARAAEPWAFTVDPYERDQDRVILDCLLRGSFDCVYEAGCGAGNLTRHLAKLCRRVIASDLVPSAVARARIRCESFNNVSVRCADLSEHLPDGPLDLIILRDVGHPMQPAEMLKISLALSRRLAAGGQFVALHGLTRHPAGMKGAKSIHNLLASTLPLEWVKGEHGVSYRLDSWVRA